MKRYLVLLPAFLLTLSTGLCQDVLTIHPEGTVEIDGELTATDGVHNIVLPIGTILMYDGTQIGNIEGRTVKIGDDPSDG